MFQHFEWIDTCYFLQFGGIIYAFFDEECVDCTLQFAKQTLLKYFWRSDFQTYIETQSDYHLYYPPPPQTTLLFQYYLQPPNHYYFNSYCLHFHLSDYVKQYHIIKIIKLFS
jgi:hypothetical protein